MNKLFFIHLILFFLFSHSSLGETLTLGDLVKRNNVYYKKFSNVPFNGKISGMESGSIIKGKKNGEWLTYYKNGQLRYKDNFKNGIPHGLTEIYNENGQLTGRGNLKYGKYDGRWKYYTNGQIVLTVHYKHGVRNGITEIYKNGKLVEKRNYKNDKLQK